MRGMGEIMDSKYHYAVIERALREIDAASTGGGAALPGQNRMVGLHRQRHVRALLGAVDASGELRGNLRIVEINRLVRI